MKSDLTTAIISTIVGILVAYFLVSGVFLKEPTPINVKTINDPATSDVSEPNPEIFNYRALNPTVEVYIDCKNYDISGACLDGGD